MARRCRDVLADATKSNASVGEAAACDVDEGVAKGWTRARAQGVDSRISVKRDIREDVLLSVERDCEWYPYIRR